MRRSRQVLFAESAEWIRANPLATIHDVPDRLVQTWCCDVEDERVPTGFYLSVFTFGYCLRQLLDSGTAPNQKITVTASKMIELFQVWQLKLGLAEVHRKTDLKVGPVALFDFPKDEAIEYWRR